MLKNIEISREEKAQNYVQFLMDFRKNGHNSYKGYTSNIKVSTNFNLCSDIVLTPNKQLVVKTTEIKNIKPSFFKRKVISLRFLIPSRYREEIIGDLLEIVSQLKSEEHGRLWISVIISWNCYMIAIGLLRIRLRDLYKDKSEKRERI